MAEHLDTGHLGEDLAQEKLLANGYTIIARNWRYKHLEIDFIAKDKQILVFVEVKTRQNTRYGHPYEAVDWRKQQKLARAAQIFLARSNHQGEIRFDIVSVVLNEDLRSPKVSEPVIKLIKDAFWPN